MTGRRTGRRPGKQDTRRQILTAARATFADRGFDRATIRQIATSAGVDPALVHHYYGTKEALFRATIEAPIDPAVVLPAVLHGDLEHIGERLVRTFLGIWSDPDTGPAIRATVRSAVADEMSANLLREFFATQIVRRITHEIGVDEPPERSAMRASLVASQMFGLALARHILRLEPLAAMPSEAIVPMVAPTIQRYLTGDLPAEST
ncbi:MAG TPA: TetR family transcriptional regulator [Nocardioidaceae bacterium]|nr:TetR family transcriptional regulator [Nocardioidaceae bacterium]